MDSFNFDDKSYIQKNLFVSTMVSFSPKLIVVDNDCVTMSMFKQLAAEKLFGYGGSSNPTSSSFSSSHHHPSQISACDLDKLKVFTFTGMEIYEDEELGILENNTYLFISSQGEQFDGRACLGAFHKIRLLGEGGYGKVYLALNKMTKEEVAIKFLKFREFKADNIHKVYKESDALRYLDHNSIVKLKMTFPLQESKSIVIVMEYASGGELKGYLDKRGRLDEEEAQEIFYQLIQAVYYCHSKRIIHRDLKLNNIVFARPNSREIKIVDFGISGLHALNNAEKSLAGSLKYMAPEILTGTNTAADPAIDIFSLGVILFALVTGKLPFDGSDAAVIKKKIIKGLYQYPSVLADQISAPCKNLIDLMLKTKVQERILMHQILKHPWIESYSKKIQTSPLWKKGLHNYSGTLSSLNDDCSDDAILIDDNENGSKQSDYEGQLQVELQPTLLIRAERNILNLQETYKSALPVENLKKIQLSSNDLASVYSSTISKNDAFFKQRLANQNLVNGSAVAGMMNERENDGVFLNKNSTLISQEKKAKYHEAAQSRSARKRRNLSVIVDKASEDGCSPLFKGRSDLHVNPLKSEFQTDHKKQTKKGSMEPPPGGHHTMTNFSPFRHKQTSFKVNKASQNLEYNQSSQLGGQQQQVVVVNNININNYNMGGGDNSSMNISNFQQQQQIIKFPDINASNGTSANDSPLRSTGLKNTTHNDKNNNFVSSSVSSSAGGNYNTFGSTIAAPQTAAVEEDNHDRLRKYIKEKLKESNNLVRPIGLTKMQKQQLNIFNRYLKELELEYERKHIQSVATLESDKAAKNNNNNLILTHGGGSEGGGQGMGGEDGTGAGGYHTNANPSTKKLKQSTKKGGSSKKSKKAKEQQQLQNQQQQQQSAVAAKQSPQIIEYQSPNVSTNIGGIKDQERLSMVRKSTLIDGGNRKTMKYASQDQQAHLLHVGKISSQMSMKSPRKGSSASLIHIFEGVGDNKQHNTNTFEDQNQQSPLSSKRNGNKVEKTKMYTSRRTSLQDVESDVKKNYRVSSMHYQEHVGGGGGAGNGNFGGGGSLLSVDMASMIAGGGPIQSIKSKYRLNPSEMGIAQRSGTTSQVPTPKLNKDISFKNNKFGSPQVVSTLNKTSQQHAAMSDHKQQTQSYTQRMLALNQDARSQQKLSHQNSCADIRFVLDSRKASDCPSSQIQSTLMSNVVKKNSILIDTDSLVGSKITDQRQQARTIYGKKFLIESILIKCDNDLSPMAATSGSNIHTDKNNHQLNQMDHLMKTMSAGYVDKSLQYKFAPVVGLKMEGKHLGGGHHAPGSYNSENLLNLVSSHTVSKI